MMRLARKSLVRAFSTSPAKIAAPPLVVITGEEFTRYAGELYLEKWIRPFVETTQWSYFDLSCKSRDQTNDQVLRDAIDAGSEVGAIYKGTKSLSHLVNPSRLSKSHIFCCQSRRLRRPPNR